MLGPTTITENFPTAGFQNGMPEIPIVPLEKSEELEKELYLSELIITKHMVKPAP